MNLENTNSVSVKRDGFTSKTGFIMACIGSAVGMGNIWRFPTMTSQWGGMTFLLPYFFCVFLISQTGVLGEMALGRAAGRGPMGAFGMATEKRWGKRKMGEAIGFIPVLGSLALAIGYSCVVGWIIKYFVMAVSGEIFTMGQDLDAIGASFASTATAWGNNTWLILALLLNFIIMGLGITDGIEKANKIMMPALFFMMLGLAIYVFTLPGTKEGYTYIFTLQPEGLKNPMLWLYAFGQAFFSLSVAGNGTVIYGSYLDKKEDIIYSGRMVACFDTLAALLAAFVIIPAMAAGGAQLSQGGPGLMFIYQVSIFNGMPGGRIVEIIFYTCVLFAGISSLVNLYEAPIAALQEKLGMKRFFAVALVGVFGCLTALFIQGVVSGWMDFVSNYICPLGAFLAGLMFFWICDKKFVMDSVNAGARRNIGLWFYRLARYLYCPLCILALIAGAILGGIG